MLQFTRARRRREALALQDRGRPPGLYRVLHVNIVVVLVYY